MAPVPVLAIALRLRTTAAFLLGSIAWFLGEMNQWDYLRHLIALPLRIIILFFVIAAVVFGIGVFVHAKLPATRLTLPGGARFPCLLGNLRISQRDRVASQHLGQSRLHTNEFLPLIQVASVTGLWGISFVVFLFAGTIATLFSGTGKPWQRLALAITVGLIVCAVVVFGEWRLQSNPSVEPVPVTLIAKDVPMSLYLGSEEQALGLLGEYAGEVRRVTPSGTQAVVLPEKIGRVSESALPEVDALFSSAATATRSAIVLGLVRKTPSAAFK